VAYFFFYNFCSFKLPVVFDKYMNVYLSAVLIKFEVFDKLEKNL
jgi:hypothetical protein